MSRLGNILNALVNRRGDTSWKTLTTGVNYRKCFGIVYVNIEGFTSTQTSGTQVIGTLPEGYRPSVNAQFFVRRGLTTSQGWITPSGIINWSPVSGTAPVAGFAVFPEVNFVGGVLLNRIILPGHFRKEVVA